MKTRRLFFVWLLLMVVSFAGCGLHQESPKLKYSEGGEVSFTATVVEIDYQARYVTLKGPNGNLVTIYVDEDAYNFDNVEVGDLVDILYHRSVAVYLQKSTGEASAVSGSGIVKAPKGQKPEASLYDVVAVKAKVENIDYANRIVDIRGPFGNLITVEVDESVKNFEKIKIGDDVLAHYTEAVALKVKPAEKD